MTNDGAKAARVAGFFVLMLGSGLILDHGSMRLALAVIAVGASSFLIGLAPLARRVASPLSSSTTERPTISQPEDH